MWIRVIDQISASRHVNLWTWKDHVTDAIVTILCSSVGKESACNAGNPGLITGWRRSPGERNGNPLQHPCLENPMDRGAYQATVHWVIRAVQDLATKPPYLYTHTHSIYILHRHIYVVLIFSSVQFSSVAQSCPTLCNPMNYSTPGLPVHHQLLEFIQTHIHRAGDAIQPSHPLSSPSPPVPNPSQHQGLFQWVNSLHEYWSFSFSIIPSNEHPGLISFRMDWLDLLAVQGTLKSLLQHHSSKTSILRHLAFFTVQLSHPYMTTGLNFYSERNVSVYQYSKNDFLYLSEFCDYLNNYITIGHILF